MSDLQGKVAVVTGAGGALGGRIALGLARRGAAVAIWDMAADAASKTQDEIVGLGGWACAFGCDVTNEASIRGALEQTLQEFDTVDILVNGAGGNKAQATTTDERSFFDLVPDDLRQVADLNFFSIVMVSQIVGQVLARRETGNIVNIASIAGMRPLTRVSTYSAGKAATVNFTQWLAVYLAQEVSPEIRVNAIAPGFILTDQNRYLLVDPETGEVTEMGRQILSHVPAGRYGDPEDVVGAVLWLISDAARFVTGAVIPVDGGFTAYAGV